MNPKFSPLGDRRENSVPCQRWRRDTWNIIPICEACLEPREKK